MARRDPNLLFPPVDQLDQRRGSIEEALITGSHQKNCIALGSDHIILFEISGVLQDLTIRLVQQGDIGPFIVGSPEISWLAPLPAPGQDAEPPWRCRVQPPTLGAG